SPRRVDRVLKASSALLRVASSLALPATAVPTAHLDPDAGKTVWELDKSSTGVATADAAVDTAPLDQPAYKGSEDAKTGIFALKKVDLFNLLCIPPDTRDGTTPAGVYQTAMAYCVIRRAMLIVDPPAAWTSANTITQNNNAALTALFLNGEA